MIFKYLTLTLFTVVMLQSLAAPQTIHIGTTVGDFADMVKDSIKPQLEKKGYTVTLTEFTDYIRPNTALAEKSLDANIFQHKPYLEAFAQAQNLKLSPLVQVPTAPLGLYAGRKKTIEAVAAGDSVAVPNDPTNLARALVILRDLGWIELQKTIDPLKADVKDISKNLKNIQIIQLEAAQLPRAKDDASYAIINGNYVVSSGLKLTDTLFQEKSDAYVNWAVVRTSDLNANFVKDLKTAYNSPEFKTYARKKFAGYKWPSNW